MPELPEVEIVKRSLVKTTIRAKIISVVVKNKNLRYKIPNSFSKNLKYEKILSISRRSKYLIFHFKKKLLLLHLGMSGKLLIIRKKDNKIFKTSFYYDNNLLHKHNHIYISLSNGLMLVYNDVRRFGFLKLYKTTKFEKIVFLQKLGFEPFNKLFSLKYFKKYLINKKKNIKNLLMDQSFVSGLGNIYVNEALFLSKINPSRSCKNLNSNEISFLISNIRRILKFAISKGGSSLKDFKNTEGENGSFQEFFRVYGQENKKCSRISCKGKIKKMIISGRSSFYCNRCQV